MKLTIIDCPLPINKKSRPGTPRLDTLAAVMHWIASAGSNPFDVWSWFHPAFARRYASANWCVANEGYIVQYMDGDEVSFHAGDEDPDGDGPLMAYTEWAHAQFGERAVSNAKDPVEGWRGSTPNYHSVGIELCHIDGEGHFTEECLESAARLCGKVATDEGLSMFDITTHKNVVGEKNCPALWASEPWRLDLFRKRAVEWIGEQQELELISPEQAVDRGIVPDIDYQDLVSYRGRV